MKRRKRDFQLYTGMWLVAIFVLLALMWQNAGDARVINYSGIVRGATQKLVKEELNGHSDDKLIETLDGIIDNLQTGKGPYRLMKNSNEKYQRLLAELKLVWEDMKKRSFISIPAAAQKKGCTTSASGILRWPTAWSLRRKRAPIIN